MTFEERMERLAERHEALAQTVEIHNAILLRVSQLDGVLAAQREQNLTNHHQREMLDGLLLATDRLVRVADRHETRISQFEH